MTKKNYLCNQVNITNEEKKRLSELGVNECHPNYEFNDLKKILWCEDVAKKEKRISDKFSSGIHQITFLTPEFDGNFTCAIVVDNNRDVWVVAYNPFSQASKPDLIVVKVWSCLNYEEAEAKALKIEKELNENNPILAVATSYRVSDKVNFEKVTSPPYVFRKDLIYSEIAKISPDDYISPLDIVRVNKGWNNQQFIIYLGKEQICNYTQEKGAHFDTWQNLLSFSTNKDLMITCFHPTIPFKKKEEIIRHIAKAVNSNFGKGIKEFSDDTGYSWTYRNDEHFVNRCVYGVNFSEKTNVDKDKRFNLQEEIKENSEKLDNLTSADVSSEINYIKNLISGFSKSEQKNRFETHVLVKPKTSCKIQ